MRPMLIAAALLLCASCQNGPFDSGLPLQATPGCLNTRADIAAATAGEQTYSTTCSYCHGVEGLGTPGRVPALNTNRLLLADPERGIRAILITQTPAARQHGMEVSDLVAIVGHLDSTDIANVMTYVVNAWGNCAGPVSVERVERARANAALRTGALSPD